MNSEQQDSHEEANFIFRYTREQAIVDGVLIRVGSFVGIDVIFTSNLFAEGYEDEKKRLDLIRRGVLLLMKPDREDSDSMMLRVIEPGEIWVIYDGDGVLTYLKPNDY